MSTAMCRFAGIMAALTVTVGLGFLGAPPASATSLAGTRPQAAAAAAGVSSPSSGDSMPGMDMGGTTANSGDSMPGMDMGGSGPSGTPSPTGADSMPGMDMSGGGGSHHHGGGSMPGTTSGGSGGSSALGWHAVVLAGFAVLNAAVLIAAGIWRHRTRGQRRPARRPAATARTA